MKNPLRLFILLGVLNCWSFAFAGRIYVDQAAAGGNTGVDWVNAFPSLVDGLNSAISGDEIWIAQGLYTPGVSRSDNLSISGLNNLSIFGGFSGNETVVTQRDFVNHQTVLSGDIGTPSDNTDNSYHVLVVTGSSNLRLNGLIIEGGTADGASLNEDRGAGLMVSGSDFVMENCILRENRAGSGTSGIGAAICFTSGNVSVVNNSVFENNRSTAHSGAIYSEVTLEIENTVFVGNQAATIAGGWDGGAITLGNAATNSYFNHCTFYNNSTDRNGGAIILSNSINAQILNSIFWANTAPNGGADVYADSSSQYSNTLITGVFGATSGANNFSSDPLFTNTAMPSGSDNIWFTPDDGLSLSATSPAINAGAGNLAKDIVGMSRDVTPDLGAYEFSMAGGNNLTLAGNNLFSPPTSLTASSSNVVVMDFNFINNSPDFQSVDGFELSVMSGNFQADVGSIGFFLGTNDVYVSQGGTTTFLTSGNIQINFTPALMFDSGTDFNFELKLSMAPSFSNTGLQLQLEPQGLIVSGGNMATGNVINTGLMALGAAPAQPILTNRIGYVPPVQLTNDQVYTPFLEFELDTMTNVVSGTLDRIEFTVPQGNAMASLAGARLYETTATSVVSDNVFVDNISGNLIFENFTWGLSGGSNTTIALEVNTPSVFPSANVLEIQINAKDIHLSSNAIVLGTFVTSGPVGLSGNVGGGAGPGFMPNLGFTPPAILNTSQTNQLVMIFDLDTMNTGYNGTLDSLAFDVFQANPSLEFSNAIIYDLSSGNLVSGSPSSVGTDNIIFNGLAWPLTSGSNVILELKVSTVGSFASTNIQINLDPAKVKLADSAAVTGSSITTGVISLVNPTVGPNLMTDFGFTPPVSLGTNLMDASVLSFELDTTTNPYSGNINRLEFAVLQSDPNVELTGLNLFNQSLLSNVSNAANVISGNIVFDNLNLGLSGGSNTILQLKVNTAGTFTGDNIQFEIHPFGIFLSDNAVINGSFVSTGPIALSGNVGPAPGPTLLPDPMYTPPASLGTNLMDAIVLSFELDTTTNPYSGNINRLEFAVLQSDPNVELTGFNLFNQSLSSNVSNAANVISGNIVFDNLNIGLSGGANITLQLQVNTAGIFTGDNIQFEIHPFGILLSDNAMVSGSFVSTGPIALSGAGNMTPQFEIYTSAFAPPMSIPSTNITAVMEMRLVSLMGGGNLTEVNVDVGQGDGLDLAEAELWDVTIGENFIASTNSFNTTSFGFNGLNIPLAPGSSTNIQVRIQPVANPSFGNIMLDILPMGVNVDGMPLMSGDNIHSGLVGFDAQAQGPQLSGVKIASGEGTAFAVADNLHIYSAGPNHVGQIGRNQPQYVDQIQQGLVVNVSAGARHGIALLQGGNVITWGSDEFGQANPTGNVEMVMAFTNAVQVEAGAYSSFVITANNELWAKGRNNMGQLGLGNFIDQNSWTMVSLPAGNIQDVSSGVEHTLVIINGHVYGFGSNGYGQLADGDTNLITNTAGVIDDVNVWVDVEAGGFHSLAIDANGDAWAWGKNDQGQLGLGHTTFVANPSQITSLTLVRAVAGGYGHSLFIVESGVDKLCYGAGSNGQGQLAQMGMNMAINPVQVGNFTDVNDIAAGPFTSMLIHSGQFVEICGKLPDGMSTPVLQSYLDLAQP